LSGTLKEGNALTGAADPKVRVLGLVGATHDSGIAILNDGIPDVVLEEERFNRQKRTQAFPQHALRAVFGKDGAGLAEVDVITTPWDVAELRRSYLKALFGNLPGSLSLLAERSHSPQRNEIVLLNQYLRRKLARNFPDVRTPRIVNVGHHDAHAAAFFVSPFEQATVLVMDGFGDDAATSVYTGAGNRLERRCWTSIFNSVGMVYTFVTAYLGFRGLCDEGKVMALAAFGERGYVDRFRECIRLLPGGLYAVNREYFSYDVYGELRPLRPKFFEIFGPPRKPGEEINDRHRAIARALQQVTEETIVHIVREITRTTEHLNLILAGGVALNCVANARILEMTEARSIWVPPAASDTGVPLGSTLWHHHQTLGAERKFELKHAFWGLEYSDEEVLRALKAARVTYEHVDDSELFARVARDLAAAKTVGWFQGRFEMGPRALGNRSILADPRRAKIRDVINAKIKHREPFRPFAPAILLERASEYFYIDQPDPFMTIAPSARPEKAHLIPAAVHADGTGRLQTVDRDSNPRFYGIIKAFENLTGVPVLLNTSFNRQERIVASPEHAISCFLRTEMDVLVLGNYYVADRNGVAKKRDEVAFADAV